MTSDRHTFNASFPLHFMRLMSTDAWPQWQEILPFQKVPFPNSKAPFFGEKIHEELRALMASEAFRTFLTEYMTSFLKGVALYQEYSPNDPPVHEKIWHKSSSSLYYIPATTTVPRAAMLFLPAFINKTDIFTFPRGGFCGFLAHEGVTSYLLDWGEGCCSSVEEYFSEILFPALQALKQQETAPLFPFGYCMGAVPALGLLSRAKEFTDLRMAGAVLLAPPWNMRVYPSGTQQFIDNAFALYEQWPASERTEPIVTTYFLNLLQPWAIFEKYARFARYEDEEKRQTFVKTENWVNDLYALSTSFVKNTLSSWFLENSLCTGRWTLFGQPLFPEEIPLPVFLAAPERDRVIPPASGKTLSESLPNCSFISPPIGHIGALVSSRAEEIFWKPCLDFMLKCVEQKTARNT